MSHFNMVLSQKNIEKIEKNPKFSKKIGIKDKTKEKLQERRGVRV